MRLRTEPDVVRYTLGRPGRWALLGYAAEAVAAALAWRDAHVPGTQIFCLIQPDNASSLGLAAKMGFVPAGRVGDGNTAQPLLALLRRH